MIFTSFPVQAFAFETEESFPVGADTSGTTGDCQWHYDSDEHILSITGSGRMADYDSATQTPWKDYGGTTYSVEIGSGVTYVGKNSFSGFRSTSISIADTVTEIGDYAFSAMRNVTMVTWGSGIRTIGDRAFSGLGVTGITLPKSLKQIGADAFEYCMKLRFLTFPNACECTFDNFTFQHCTALENVTVGKNAVIGDNCFAYCSSVKRFQVSADSSLYSEVGGCLYSKDQKKLIAYCNGNGKTSEELPSSVSEIGNYAFAGNTTLTSMMFPAGLKKIGLYSFYMSQIVSLSFRGSDLQSVGKSAFYSTPWYNNQSDKLVYVGTVAYQYKGTPPKSVVLRDGTKGIGESCFQNKMTLENITLPDSLLIINRHAFYGCENLTGVELPSKLKVIGDYAFAQCRSITKAILPDSVTEIGERCFTQCNSLKELRLSKNLKEIPYMAFASCVSLDCNIEIPVGVTKLASGAFHGCQNADLTVRNRETEFEEDSPNIAWGKIYGYHGSTAEAYAKKKQIRFQPLDKYLTGTVTSYLSSNPVKLNLTDQKTSAAVAEISVTGADYTFTDVNKGEYVLTVSKKNHVTRTYRNVKVRDNDAVQDVKICPIGDISGDGKVTSKDSSMAFQRAQGRMSLDEYQQQCGDVVKNDNKITSNDASRIFQHAQNKSSLWQ